MRYVAAYLLAVLGGNANPNASQIEKILSSVGVDAEADKVKQVLEQLKGKNVEELIAEGQEKLATVPSGGGGGGAPAAAPAADAGADAGKKDEKPAKKEEPESESDDDMGFGLFD